MALRLRDRNYRLGSTGPGRRLKRGAGTQDTGHSHSGAAAQMNDQNPVSPSPDEVSSGAPALPEDVLLVVPVRNVVMFPGAVTQVALAREISMRAVQEAVTHGHKLGIVLQKDPSVDEPGPDDLYKIGTTVTVVRYIKAPN